MIYRTTPQVDRVLAGEGISLDRFQQMVTASAVYSQSERGNRRYYGWLFQIDGDLCSSMQRVYFVERGCGDSAMQEICGDCEGEGCKSCGWIGTVLQYL